MTRKKNSKPSTPTGKEAEDRDLTLSEEDAEASGPADQSVVGEEDPGAALEFFVKHDEKPDRSSDKGK